MSEQQRIFVIGGSEDERRHVAFEIEMQRDITYYPLDALYAALLEKGKLDDQSWVSQLPNDYQPDKFVDIPVMTLYPTELQVLPYSADGRGLLQSLKYIRFTDRIIAKYHKNTIRARYMGDETIRRVIIKPSPIL